MNIIKTKNKSLLDKYKSLILERDDVKKDAFNYQEKYYRTFGEYIKTSFSLKVDCIRLKKKIGYCQLCINQQKEITEDALNTYIAEVMQAYDAELRNIIAHVNASKNSKSISNEDYSKIKKIYRKIVKLIHPDMNPELFKNPRIQELWNRLSIAYECNDLEELENIEVLIAEEIENKDLNIEVENLEQRIKKLEEEIQNIKNTNPYQYKYLLDDSEEEISRFKKEIEDYTNYQKELEKILSSFNIKKNIYS